jgi:hypothetical protein
VFASCCMCNIRCVHSAEMVWWLLFLCYVYSGFFSIGVYWLFLRCGVVCLGCWCSFCVFRCHRVSYPFKAVHSLERLILITYFFKALHTEYLWAVQILSVAHLQSSHSFILLMSNQKKSPFLDEGMIVKSRFSTWHLSPLFIHSFISQP